MPSAAPSRCPLTGCNNKTTHAGRCDDHQRKAWENPSANSRALTGGDRARIRRTTLARHPVCRCTGWCGQHQGMCHTPSVEADHVIPIGEGGARDDPGNLQGLCGPCHAVKTRTDKARIAARRRTR